MVSWRQRGGGAGTDGWGKEWQDLEGGMFPPCKKPRDEDMSYRTGEGGELSATPLKSPILKPRWWRREQEEGSV